MLACPKVLLVISPLGAGIRNAVFLFVIRSSAYAMVDIAITVDSQLQGLLSLWNAKSLA